jgi:rhamnose utilization protein RhaD (predicted bifunctional aldolase and dehydrogenase)
LATKDLSSLNQLCASMGSNPLLVQGAGGNVSWKGMGKMFVKASGTWLEKAEKENIFVEIDFADLRTALLNEDYEHNPKVLEGSNLRPSIETTLHALMPQPVVAHLHMIDALVDLIKVKADIILPLQLPLDLKWICVDYYKPGSDLAKAVAEEMSTSQFIPSVIFLKNHGVVVGGENPNDIQLLVSQLMEKLRKKVRSPQVQLPSIETRNQEIEGYTLNADPLVNKLAQCEDLWLRLQNSWALYPDHVVFLGAKPLLFESLEQFSVYSKNESVPNGFVFIKNIGVFSGAEFSVAQQLQLRCYYDVLIRTDSMEKLTPLSDFEIRELVDWDSETYRINLSRK